MDQEANPSSLGTQEQLDEFDAWVDDFGTDDDVVPTEEYDNSGPKKYILSLHKYPEVPFFDNDIKERTLRWIIVSRANGKIDPITEPDYKYLNKNDIKDLYLLCVNSKLGMESYQQKVNLTALTITFPSIERKKLFSITSEPLIGMIYENIKKEKRVMIHKENPKFYDATLKRVLEKLKKYNKDVKYGYANPSPSDADA
ncbi:hypothetical protein Tco_0707203 [Tanacetum coccineum]|uniref:Uncharacterized protein n=1 Tax=Tanacetum coccineum TaxID=301880 RepID=A0ABQ4YB58_9ASTR